MKLEFKKVEFYIKLEFIKIEFKKKKKNDMVAQADLELKKIYKMPLELEWYKLELYEGWNSLL